MAKLASQGSVLSCQPSVNSEPEAPTCRICFQPEILGNTMLVDACSCKGSVRNVHELCLVKWLQMQNTRKCELCKTPYNMQEEYGSAIQVAKKSVSYIFGDPKRVMMLCVYSFYLYLLYRRTRLLIGTFGKQLWRAFTSMFSKREANKVTVLNQARKAMNYLQRFRKVAIFLKQCLLMAYNAFISMQLLQLGRIECIRIKRFISNLLNQARVLRVRERAPVQLQPQHAVSAQQQDQEEQKSEYHSAISYQSDPNHGSMSGSESSAFEFYLPPQAQNEQFFVGRQPDDDHDFDVQFGIEVNLGQDDLDYDLHHNRF